MDGDGRGGAFESIRLGSTASIDHAPSVSNTAALFRQLADAIEQGGKDIGFLLTGAQRPDNGLGVALMEMPKCVAWAKKALKIRDQRAKFFPAEDIFGEPCWDMILDLFVAKATGKSISVTSACVAARVPATTALRWLTVLERGDLIERVADANDGRRVYVSLTDSAFEATKSLIESIMD